MEDRYLFKAKRLDNGEWEIGSLIALPTGEYEISNKCNNPPDCDPMWDKVVITHKVDPSTISQCTGLNDKNENLIWENDIVKCVDENNGIEFTAIIEFGNPNGLYSWGYQLQHIKGDEPNLDILLWVDMEEAGATCKVIGNKFDNPELLEV